MTRETNIETFEKALGTESDPAYESREAAKYIGTTVANLANSRSSGLLFGHTAPRFLKAGRKRLYRLSELNRFLGDLEVFTNNTEVHLSGSDGDFPFA